MVKVSTQLLILNLHFYILFTVLNMNMHFIIATINNSPKANLYCIIWWLKMTIFILLIQQKTRGPISKKQEAEIARPL